MVCDTRLKPRQTISQRAAEVREAVIRLAAALAAGRVKAIVDRRTGAIAFTGWETNSRDGLTDGCAYRQIMSTGSATAKLLILQAEQLAGRPVNKQAVAQGLHTHDNGASWHKH